MKHTKSLIAITIMAILATTVTIVSCKKDNLNTLYQKGYTIQQAADIRQIEDPQAYMLDFKKKLSESKDCEAFGLNDAAWHLACLANLDFCNINVQLDDFQFDTVEMKVNVSDGIILLDDLRSAYQQMCTKIRQFQKVFNHCDQNLYYINVSISADGNAKIALMTSFNTSSKDLEHHQWYFSNLGAVLTACDEYFSDNSTYVWNGLAATELQRILNIYEHHEYQIPVHGGYQMVYFPTRNHTFDFTNTSPDPYGSPFYEDSRVFRMKGSNYANYCLEDIEMCYCLDSYLGLGYDYMNDYLYTNEHPVCWSVNDTTIIHLNNLKTHYHRLYVEYGNPISINPPGPFN
jgi:hypothetical protein